jgi:hypothetical protein
MSELQLKSHGRVPQCCLVYGYQCFGGTPASIFRIVGITSNIRCLENTVYLSILLCSIKIWCSWKRVVKLSNDYKIIYTYAYVILISMRIRTYKIILLMPPNLWNVYAWNHSFKSYSKSICIRIHEFMNGQIRDRMTLRSSEVWSRPHFAGVSFSRFDFLIPPYIHIPCTAEYHCAEKTKFLLTSACHVVWLRIVRWAGTSFSHETSPS